MLKYFKYPLLFSLNGYFTLRMRRVPVCVLFFWQDLFIFYPPPVCLLIEILIEISEGDFNHKGVARAYLSEPQRKKKSSSRRCHPLSLGSLCQGERERKKTVP